MAAGRKSGLGRSLNALLGPKAQLSIDDIEPKESQSSILPVEFLQPGKYQPRHIIDDDALQELACSIKAQGIIQPIVVRRLVDQHYEIIAGERRWRAAQIAGLTEVPVIIRDLSDEEAIAISLIENIQRENLNPMEEVRALQQLLEEFALTHQEVADAVGKSRAAVTNLLRLMNLQEEVKTLLERGDLEMGHARALLSLPSDKQLEMAHHVIDRELSVRETEKAVRRQLHHKEKIPPPTMTPPETRGFQEHLAEKLKTKVSIQHSPRGKGSVTIYYHTVDKLEEIIKRIQ